MSSPLVGRILNVCKIPLKTELLSLFSHLHLGETPHFKQNVIFSASNFPPLCFFAYLSALTLLISGYSEGLKRTLLNLYPIYVSVGSIYTGINHVFSLCRFRSSWLQYWMNYSNLAEAFTFHSIIYNSRDSLITTTISRDKGPNISTEMARSRHSIYIN